MTETTLNNNLGDNPKPSGGRELFDKVASIKPKQALSYMLLPGIIPETKALLQSNFGYLAFLVAMIYQMVRILPKNHPYTRPENIGRFNIRQVIAMAANHVQFRKENIDQIVVFTAVMAGMLLVIAQFASLVFFLLSGQAFAQEITNLFTTPSPQTDVAFYMMREVFGIPNMFGDVSAGENRTGLHQGLQLLVKFYNFAILFVAVIVFLYYLITVVGETATTGVPFGQRFSHVYAPLRLVIAIGLLVPLNFGFNGAQYIAFYAAELGSGFASQGWRQFNETAATNPLGLENALLVAQPNSPDLTGLVEGIATIIACKEAYALQDVEIKPYFIDPSSNEAIGIGGDSYRYIRNQARAAGIKSHITIYFSKVELNEAVTTEENKGALCGQIKLPIQVNDQTIYNATGNASPDKVQEIYYDMVHFLYFRNGELHTFGKRLAHLHDDGPDDVTPACEVGTAAVYAEGAPIIIQTALPGDCDAAVLPPTSWRQKFIDRAADKIKIDLDIFFNDVRGQVNFKISEDVINTGWGGAGIWYNSIAEMNGAFTTAVVNPPNIEKRPAVAERVVELKSQIDGGDVNDCDIYSPDLAGDKTIKLMDGESDLFIARAINESHKYWRCDRGNSASNFFWDTMTAVFGLNGLFNIRDEVNGDPNDPNAPILVRESVQPIAKLSVIGKGLVESSVQNLGLAMASSFSGGMLGILSQHLGASGQAASSMFVSIATVGLSVGFILYYILPFLPFMYFFFAVGGWVKGIFEAMVGTPLWALAHLRIDGDGLPGRSAVSGYLLIMDIFLRPILTVFGLVGGIAIFSALATMLNEIFDLAVLNVTGTETNAAEGGEIFGRHIIDEFFFTVMYAIILYMMATSSFKMITLVPNNILRWLGQSVSTFNDNAPDPTQGLTQYAAMGGARIGGQLGQAASSGSQAIGSGIGEVLNAGAPRTPQA